MKFRGGTVLTFLLALVLAGCGTQLQKAQGVNPSGDAFSSSLHHYYLQFSAHEYGEGDYIASDWAAKKAIAAAAGEYPEPNQVDASKIAAKDRVGELAEGRRLLVETLDAGGRQALPDSAAKAQVDFDCWLHEEEEGWEEDEIVECKEAFLSALNAVQLAMAPEPEPEPVMIVEPEPEVEAAVFLVYFDFDKSNVRSDQEAIMDVIEAAAKAAPDRAIHIVAHTDTVGSIDYNQALSERRKNTVVGDLLASGIDRGRVSAEAVGKTQPLVDTGDQVRDQANRVATVTLF